MSLITDILFRCFCHQEKEDIDTNNVLKYAPTAESIDIGI